MTRTIPDRRPYAKRKRLQLEAGRRRAESHSCCKLKGLEILWITAFFMVWSSIAIVILNADPHSPSTAVLGNYHEISHLDANEADSRRLMDSAPTVQHHPTHPTVADGTSKAITDSVKELEEWYGNEGSSFYDEEARGMEIEVDKRWMEMYPEIDRPASPVARDQGKRTTCWVYAAATLLRTKQKVLTPYQEVYDKIQEIKWKLLRDFLLDFQSRYRADEVDGMKCWMESEWRELTESPVMKKLFPVDWRDHMRKETFLTEDPMAQRLILQFFWNSYGFSYSEIIYWKPYQDTWKNQEPKIKAMLQHERALISLVSEAWDEVNTQPREFFENGGHSMVLDRFDAQTGEYIVKNSQGPRGGSEGRQDGTITEKR